MDTEQIKMITDLLKDLGGEAKTAFIAFLLVDFLKACIIPFIWTVVIYGGYKAVRVIAEKWKEKDIEEAKICRESEYMRESAKAFHHSLLIMRNAIPDMRGCSTEEFHDISKKAFRFYGEHHKLDSTGKKIVSAPRTEREPT